MTCSYSEASWQRVNARSKAKQLVNSSHPKKIYLALILFHFHENIMFDTIIEKTQFAASGSILVILFRWERTQIRPTILIVEKNL